MVSKLLSAKHYKCKADKNPLEDTSTNTIQINWSGFKNALTITKPTIIILRFTMKMGFLM